MNTLRITRNSLLMFAAVAAMSFMTQSASAQGCAYGGGGGYYGGGGYGGGISLNIGRGYGGYGRGISRGYGHGINHGYNSYRPSYRRPYFHDTTHLDYHGPRLVPHGNHLDYIPGHYDVHRTGHWHR